MNYVTKCEFNTVLERDIDILMLHLFATDKSFVRLFLDKAESEYGDFDIETIELGKADANLGESDITVIINVSGKRIAILIEDKIDAIAMPRQPERYIQRGDKAVANGEYDKYYSFITCPQKYYDNNDAAKEYPYLILYEEIRDYIKKVKSPVYSVYYQEISQAIERAKKPPKVVINENANSFFRKYKDYQESHFPRLDLRTKRESNGYWAHYNTRLGNAYLYHKINDGKVDLTFPKASEQMQEMELFADWLRKHGIENAIAVVTGKAGAIRIPVPRLDMQIPFEDNDEYDIEACFKAISELIETVNMFSLAGGISNL